MFGRVESGALQVRKSLGRLTSAAALVAMAGCSNPPPSADAASLKFERLGSTPDIYTVVLQANAKPAEIEMAVRDHCGAREFCQVFGWVDRSRVARAFPMTDRELSGLVFDYKLNRSTGLDRAGFSCRLWPSVPKDQCRSEWTSAGSDDSEAPKK